jgi:RND family efflux transporter MFP subunit
MKCTLYFLGSLTLAVSLIGCGQSDNNEEAAGKPAAAKAISLQSSAVVSAQRQTIHPEFRLPAVVEAIQQAALLADVPATLIHNHFTAGDIVEQGALLVELDPSQYQAALDAANAELMSAKANLQQAEANWKRAEDLAPKGFISNLDYDKARASLGIAQAAVAKANAGLTQASINLAHTKIYAPFSGRISKPVFATGDYVPVAPGTSPLFELVQLDPIYVTANIALNVYNDFVLLRQELEGKGVEIPELEIHLELAGGRPYTHIGKFENWSHTSSQSTGMIAGRTVLPNPEGLLLPGQNVMIVGRAAKELTRVMVPQKAIMQDQQGKYLLLVDESDTIQRRNVEVGIRDGANWAIRDGLDEGARVIVEGLQMLRPGTKITINSN